MGLNAIDWIAFLIVWFLHIVVFWQGMGWVERFLNFAGSFVYAVMIALVIVLWIKADGQLLSSARTIFANPEGTWGTEFTGFVAIFGTMVAYFAAVMINFSDFSRFAKDKNAMTKGNLMGLPFNMILFSALALLTTAGAAVVYGEEIINPTEIVEKADSVLLSVIAAITFFAATMGINLVANFIPAVNGIANLSPEKIAFGIAALFSIATVWVPALSQLSGYAWIIGAGLGGLIYHLRCKAA